MAPKIQYGTQCSFPNPDPVSLSLCAPVHEMESSTLGNFFKYLSHFKADRQQLKTNKLYNLKICLESFHLTDLSAGLSTALNKGLNSRRAGRGTGSNSPQKQKTGKDATAVAKPSGNVALPLGSSLFSAEDALCQALLSSYEAYQKITEGDPLSLLNGRFTALMG